VPAIADASKSEQRHATSTPLKPTPSKPVIVRCMVYSRCGEYVAECIDLDLMARGATTHEAFRSLNNAMSGYLKTVLKGAVEGLLPRPAPLSHRLHYHWLVLRTAVTIGVRRNFFVTDCPLEACSCGD
jgi:hypothetical protein